MNERSSPATATLLPCPFCGGKPIWQAVKGGQAVDFDLVYRVNCSECYRIDMPYWTDQIDCMKQWNARTPDGAARTLDTGIENDPCPYAQDGCVLEANEIGPCLCANHVRAAGRGGAAQRPADCDEAIKECQAWREAVVQIRDMAIEWGTPAIETKCFNILMDRPLYPISSTQSDIPRCEHGNPEGVCTICHMWSEVARPHRGSHE